MITYFTVEDNTAPALEITLNRNGSPINLDGATVTLAIQNKKTKEITNTGHQTCSIADPDSGSIAYQVEVDDFPDPNVDYLAEIKIVHSSGRSERIYDLISVSLRNKIH